MFLATRPNWRLLLGGVTFLLCIVVVIFLLKFIAARRRFLGLRKHGLVMPFFISFNPPIPGQGNSTP